VVVSLASHPEAGYAAPSSTGTDCPFGDSKIWRACLTVSKDVKSAGPVFAAQRSANCPTGRVGVGNIVNPCRAVDVLVCRMAGCRASGLQLVQTHVLGVCARYTGHVQRRAWCLQRGLCGSGRDSAEHVDAS
jgi:hypothetical protein